MYSVTIVQTTRRTLTMEPQDFLDLMESVTGKKVNLDPEADQADQVYDMIDESSEIQDRIINHPDAEIVDDDLEVEELDSDA